MSTKYQIFAALQAIVVTMSLWQHIHFQVPVHGGPKHPISIGGR
jgi:hypothetical protein